MKQDLLRLAGRSFRLLFSITVAAPRIICLVAGAFRELVKNNETKIIMCTHFIRKVFEANQGQILSEVHKL